MAPSFSMSGAVDLSALKKPAPAAGAAAGGPAAGAGSAPSQGPAELAEVGEAEFQAAVLERSLSVPVVVVFSAGQLEQSRQFDALLARLAAEAGVAAARVEAQSNPRLAAAMRVQGLPTVLAVVGGELLGEFSGILPEGELRQWLAQLVELARREFGMEPVAGAAPDGPAEDAADEPPLDPALAAAYAALESDDLDGAAQALRNVLSQTPAHAEAAAMLLQVELMQRTQDADPDAALAAAQAAPGDPDKASAAGDALFAAGRVDEALELMLGAVRDSAGEDRDRLRRQLVDFFSLLGPEDPRVGKARARLTSLLF